MLRDVPACAALFEHVALHNGDEVFGSFDVIGHEQGVDIWLVHTLLGDFFEEQLKVAAGTLAVAVDGLDDALQKQFGGRRFADSDSVGVIVDRFDSAPGFYL